MHNMKLNLNNALVVGTMSKDVDNNGKHTFTRWGMFCGNKDKFLQFCQYLIDGCPDVSDFVIVDVESQNVLSFSGLVFETLGMKSKRYEH